MNSTAIRTMVAAHPPARCVLASCVRCRAAAGARAHARPLCTRRAGAARAYPRGRALTRVAARGLRQSELLSDEKLAEFNEAFDLFDKKKEGKIPSLDLITVFQAMKLNISKREEQEYLAARLRCTHVYCAAPAGANPLLATRAVRIVTWPCIADARP